MCCTGRKHCCGLPCRLAGKYWRFVYDVYQYANVAVAFSSFAGSENTACVTWHRSLSDSYWWRRQILDIDLDVWRRRGGDLTAGADTVGNNKPGVGVEERNFSQNDDSASHLAALRVQV